MRLGNHSGQESNSDSSRADQRASLQRQQEFGRGRQGVAICRGLLVFIVMLSASRRLFGGQSVTA